MPFLASTSAHLSRRARAAVVAVVLAGVLAPAAAWAATEATIGSTTLLSDSAPPDPPVMQRGVNRYDYAPSVLYDAQAGLYRMWWCGGVAGDYVLYAESTTIGGPFHSRSDPTPHTYDIALRPTGDGRSFDSTHTCDPSVIKVGRTWYLYYGGANEKESGAPTRIGMATSKDGVSWKRANRGKPIISPVRHVNDVPNGYGAGQPSITHVDGTFHIVFTDTTGYGGNLINGAGQYVMRSADPLFKDNVEELQSGGFAPYSSQTHTRHSLIEAFSTDWQFSPALDAFALSESRTNVDAPKTIRVHFYPRTLTREVSGSPAVVEAGWAEGTGLIGGLDRRLTSPTDGSQRIEVMRPMGESSPFTWRLYPVVAQVAVTLPTA